MLVDARWDISRGDRRAQNYALSAAFVDPKIKDDAIWVLREKQMAEGAFIHLVSRFKLIVLVVQAQLVHRFEVDFCSDLVSQI